MPIWTIASLLAVSTDYLRTKSSTSPRLDAELLLAETLGVDRIQLYAQYDRPVTPSEVAEYRVLVARRATGEPVAYILGRASFRYLTLRVGPDVLIPRPETEELVGAVLAWLGERPLFPSAAERGETDSEETSTTSPAVTPLVVDVGTGSGAIALALAQEAAVAVLATDGSAAALSVARENAGILGLSDLVRFVQGDLLEGLSSRAFRVVVSNPPYVSEAEFAGLAPDVRLFEPRIALEGGADGLAVHRRIMPQAARVLGPGGAVFLEVGESQGRHVELMAREAGFCLAHVARDMSGKERVLHAVLPGAPPLDVGSMTAGDYAALGRALHAGALLGVPTDTVYGLAADWQSARGIRGLFAAKGRDGERPVAVLFSSVEEVLRSLPDLEAEAVRVLRALLPGPFTFVVETHVPRPPLVGTEESLGIRVPAHPGLLGLLSALGVPLAATSANLSGRPDPAALSEVDPEVLAHCCAAIVDLHGDAPDPAGTASTVVDLRPLAVGRAPLVLREGAVSAAEVEERIAAIEQPNRTQGAI